MSRPVKLFCYKIGRDLGLDIDIVMSWKLDKIYEYMAFYMTESTEYKDKYIEDNMTVEDRHDNFLKILGV